MAKPMIGLDIGSTDTRIAVWDGSVVRRLLRIPMPDNLVKDGVIVSYDAMADFLKQALRENRINGRDCAVILPARHAFLRRIIMPVMTEEQLRVNLPYEFRDFLTMGKDKYFYDYAINEVLEVKKAVSEENSEEENPESESEKQLDIIAAAVPKDVIADYREMLSRAGLKLKVAVPVEYAYNNILRRNAEIIPDECCFLNITAASSRLDIFVGTRFETSRIIDNGVNAVVSAVADDMNVDVNIARNYLQTNFKDAQNLPVSNNVYSNIALDVRKAVNFYGFSNRESNLQKMYYCGYGSSIEPLVENIKGSLELELASASELLPKVADGVSENPDACICAIGAAIQNIEKTSRKKATELPQKTSLNMAMREASGFEPKKVLPLVAAVLVVGVLFGKFAVADRFAAVNDAERHLEELKDHERDLNSELADFDAVSSEYARYSTGWMEEFEHALVPRTDVLDLIEKELQPSSKITEISAVGNRFSVCLAGISFEQASSLVQKLTSREDVLCVDIIEATAEPEDPLGSRKTLSITMAIPKSGKTPEKEERGAAE